jgi:heptosyltransferase-2
LHLAIALKKNVVGLFGSTSHKEVYFYGRGKAILPKDILECMPCYSAKCLNDKLCINSITSEEVYTQLKEVMKRPI